MAILNISYHIAYNILLTILLFTVVQYFCILPYWLVVDLLISVLCGPQSLESPTIFNISYNNAFVFVYYHTG